MTVAKLSERKLGVGPELLGCRSDLSRKAKSRHRPDNDNGENDFHSHLEHLPYLDLSDTGSLFDRALLGSDGVLLALLALYNSSGVVEN